MREVFARVRNADPAVADLYTEDAIILYGGSGRAVGREEIRAFYVRTFDAIAPQPQVEAVLEEPPRFVAIVDVPTEGAIIERSICSSWMATASGDWRSFSRG